MASCGQKYAPQVFSECSLWCPLSGVLPRLVTLAFSLVLSCWLFVVWASPTHQCVSKSKLGETWCTFILSCDTFTFILLHFHILSCDTFTFYCCTFILSCDSSKSTDMHSAVPLHTARLSNVCFSRRQLYADDWTVHCVWEQMRSVFIVPWHCLTLYNTV